MKFQKSWFRYLGQVCLLGLALLALVATGGDDSEIGGGEPGLPPEAREAALVLLNSVSIESTADILFSGPVEPGTIVRENDIPEDQVELQVPDTPGTYYIFLIDDHPNKMFEHPVRYAWVNLDTNEVEYIDASNLMTIYPPNKEPSPFRKVGSDEVNGIFFNFYEGEGAAEPVDVTHKTAVETFNASDIGVSIVYHSRRESLKIASVTDFGDENGIRSLSKNMAERNADRIGKWVKDNGFNVQRISQYSGNNYPRFNYKPSTNVTDYIASFGTFFKSIGPPDEYCDEFFLYITGHGKGESPRENGGVKLYPANGAADFEMVYWEHLLAAFDNFPPYVKVTVFLDACFSGKAIIDLPQSERVTIKQGQNRTKLESLCNKLCVITVITSTDQHLAAIAPQFLHFSATEDFMIGDSRYADFDEDGIKGDIYDRTITMKGHVGNTNPQFYHCPPGESWCSLDGSQTVWDEPPIANAGDDQVAELDSTVQLDGSNSNDPEGALLLYKWTFKSKPEGSNAVLSADNVVNPTFVPDVLGTYTLELVVNDGFKDSEPSTVTITASAQVYTTLDVPGASYTYAYGINDAGYIVGTYSQGSGRHGFVYDGSTYTTLDVPVLGVTQTFAHGINNSNHVVGYYIDYSHNRHGFVYDGSTYTTLDVNLPNAMNTQAYGINNSGHVAGYYYDPTCGCKYGFFYDGGTYTKLDVPGAKTTYAFDINDSGYIVGQYYDASWNIHGFVYDGSTYTTLDLLGASRTYPHGINDLGNIAGYYIDGSGNHRGFVYDSNTYTTLHVPDASRTEAFDINDSGDVVGDYYDGSYYHGFTYARE